MLSAKEYIETKLEKELLKKPTWQLIGSLLFATDVVGKAVFGSAVEFFPVIAKKMKNAWNQEEPPASGNVNPERVSYDATPH